VPLQDGIPIFTTRRLICHPSDKITRSQIAYPLGQANWSFLEDRVKQLDTQAAILDVGAGRGDFTELFEGYSNYLALDIYPYPEVDIVCDLSCTNPFRLASLDAIVLMNVLEHGIRCSFSNELISEMLKPGGILIVAVPSLSRCTRSGRFQPLYHYACSVWVPVTEWKLSIWMASMTRFSPAEGIGNLRNAVLPTLRGTTGTRTFLSKVLQASTNLLRRCARTRANYPT